MSNTSKKTEYMRQWRAKNAEKNKQYQKEYYEKYSTAENRRKAVERAQKYYENNREHVLEMAKARHSAKPKKGRVSGESHHNWKGDKVGYFGLHGWVERQLGTPQKCEVCGSTTARRFEWANLSHEYKRDVNDWKRMCTSCHRKFDIAHGWGNPAGRRKKET
jgi:hypothetical protein